MAGLDQKFGRENERSQKLTGIFTIRVIVMEY